MKRSWLDVCVQAARTALVSGDEPPPRAASAGLWLLRRTTIVMLAGAVVFTAYVSTVRDGYGPVDWNSLLFAVLTAAPVLLTLRLSLTAWRVTLLLALVTPQIYQGFEDKWGWEWTPGLALAAVVVLYVVASRHTQPVVVAVWLVSVGVAAVRALLAGTDGRSLVLLAGMLAAVLLLGNTVRLRRVAEWDRIAKQEEQARATAVAERTRLARELHDVVAHHMSVLAVRADSAPYRLTDLSDPVREEFAALNATAREGLNEIRRLLGVLRASNEQDVEIAPQPGVAQIEELVDRLRDSGTRVTLAVDAGPVPSGVALSAYRIVQEALSNATRHAPGCSVDVHLRLDSEVLKLDVRNTPGTKPVKSGTPGHGLVGMRERVDMLRGTLHTGSTAGGGFAVSATIPLEVR